MRMHAAHIIPSLLNNFDDKVINSPQIVRDVLYFSHFIQLCLQTDACSHLGHASVLDPNRLSDTHGAEYQPRPQMPST
jgi:hypothetical protein